MRHLTMNERIPVPNLPKIQKDTVLSKYKQIRDNLARMFIH